MKKNIFDMVFVTRTFLYFSNHHNTVS